MAPAKAVFTRETFQFSKISAAIIARVDGSEPGPLSGCSRSALLAFAGETRARGGWSSTRASIPPDAPARIFRGSTREYSFREDKTLYKTHVLEVSVPARKRETGRSTLAYQWTRSRRGSHLFGRKRKESTMR